MIFVRFMRMPAVIVVTVFAALGVMSVLAQERPAERAPVFKVESSGSSLAFAPSGKILACDLVLRDLAGKELAKGVFGKDPPECTHVAFSPDGKKLASVHYDRGLIMARHAIYLWNVTADNELHLAATLQLTKDQYPPYRESLHYLTFSPDGKMLAARQPDDATVVWETASGREQVRLDTQGLVVAFARDGRSLTSVTRDGLVQHWDLATKKCTDPKDASKREDFLFVESAIASADGETVALTDGYSVLLKDARSGKTLRRFDDLNPGCLALSKDGKTLAVDIVGGVVLFDTGTGKEQARLSESKKWVHALAFSPDAKSLAVASGESVSVWEIAKLHQAPKGEVKRDPSSVSLEAELTSRNDNYTLDLGGKTPEEFARLVKKSSLPPAPTVDLVLTFRNTGKKKLTIDLDMSIYLHLIGDGAMNHPMESYQTCVQFGDEPKKVTLAYGETYSVPIKSLDRGHCERSYWLLPGEYSLHASSHVCVTPVADDKDKESDKYQFVTLRVPPVRVKVVAEKK